jgi:hypothetical protein
MKYSLLVIIKSNCLTLTCSNFTSLDSVDVVASSPKQPSTLYEGSTFMLVSIGISIVMTVGATIAVALWTQNGNESEGNVKNYFIMI